MNDQNSQDAPSARGDEFDRAAHRFKDRPDVVSASATEETVDMLGIVEQWTVRRYSERIAIRRGEKVTEQRADTILLTRGKGEKFLRLVIPPNIVRIIDRQYDSLTTKKRKKIGREVIERRIEAGEDVGAALRDPKVQAKARAARKANARK